MCYFTDEDCEFYAIDCMPKDTIWMSDGPFQNRLAIRGHENPIVLWIVGIVRKTYFAFRGMVNDAPSVYIVPLAFQGTTKLQQIIIHYSEHENGASFFLTLAHHTYITAQKPIFKATQFAARPK